MESKKISGRALLGRREFTLGLGAAALAAPALAQSGPTRIAFGYTAVTDFASVYVAAEEGYFKKRNLDVELKFIPLNSTIPAAIESGSLQLGGPTPSVFLLSVAGGLDHVVVAGGGLTSKTNTSIALAAKAGSGIRTAKDCEGRRIGVPGLGAYLHVTLRAWLKQAGVDYRRVNFIEAAFPQHADLLRGGSIDAVATADPMLSRILETSVGYVVSYYPTFLAEGQTTLNYVGTRRWVQQNPAAVKSFKAAVDEAAVFIRQPKNDALVRQHIGKYIKLPPEVIARMQIAPPGPTVTDRQLAFWVDMMKDQQMLKPDFAAGTLIAGT